jgi:hypothetical protein
VAVAGSLGQITHVMKSIVLIIFFTLIVMICHAEDYRLVQSQVADEVPKHGSVDKATVYVLLCPDQRVYVFRAFYTHQMEAVIMYFPKGSVLHYEGMGVGGFAPPQDQMQALTALCKSKTIVLKIAPTN